MRKADIGRSACRHIYSTRAAKPQRYMTPSVLWTFNMRHLSEKQWAAAGIKKNIDCETNWISLWNSTISSFLFYFSGFKWLRFACFIWWRIWVGKKSRKQTRIKCQNRNVQWQKLAYIYGARCSSNFANKQTNWMREPAITEWQKRITQSMPVNLSCATSTTETEKNMNSPMEKTKHNPIIILYKYLYYTHIWK